MHKNNFSSYHCIDETEEIIPIYCITGVAYGMVELIRGVFPKVIVDGNDQQLRRNGRHFPHLRSVRHRGSLLHRTRLEPRLG